ncbi:hypothetical protein P9279_30570, partial [Mesorhizobium sp. WSM4962]|uniref:hypothetical protein n=1 Tax=Mesorhizobium sp. WSM4962 TaxID=3038548 RepID=UPI002417D693
MPFFNAGIQGFRTFLRTWATDRDIGPRRTRTQALGRALAFGVGSVMVPTLALWWQNKDKEWY